MESYGVQITFKRPPGKNAADAALGSQHPAAVMTAAGHSPGPANVSACEMNSSLSPL